MPEKRYPVYHKHECGEIGMYTSMEDPQVGDLLLASKFFRLDGSGFEIGEEAICGHCGKHMTTMIHGQLPIEWIDYDNPVEVPDA